MLDNPMIAKDHLNLNLTTHRKDDKPMEVAFLVIAVIGLLALSGAASGGGKSVIPAGGGIGTIPPPPQPPQPQPMPYTPVAAPPAQIPMVPSTSSNVNGQVFSGAAQVGTQVATQAVQNTGASGLGLTAATAGIAAGVGIIASIAASLLAAHKARLQGALNENQAADRYVPVFDSFVQSIANAYNSKQATAADCATALQQFDQYLYQQMRALANGPGTSWNDATGKAGKCDKSCTVSCCLYWQDLSVVLNDMSYVLGFPTGKWGAGDPRINGRTITAPKVYPSKYSSYSREIYTITLN